jgi:hypothetical protein
MLIQSMTIEQTLLQEIEESQRWFNLEKDESTYKKDLAKRVELNKLGFRKYEKTRYSNLQTN